MFQGFAVNVSYLRGEGGLLVVCVQLLFLCPCFYGNHPSFLWAPFFTPCSPGAAETPAVLPPPGHTGKYMTQALQWSQFHLPDKRGSLAMDV